MSGGDETLFGRWSRRKRAVAAEDLTREPAARVPGEAPVPDVEETEEEALARLGLPDPECLGAGDDFTGFMKSGVPQVLRRKALRRLWRTNPVLANLDGLNDYDEDFGAAEHTPALVATAYKVGRGFVKAIADPGEDPAGEDGSVTACAEASSSVRKPGADLPEDVPLPSKEAESSEGEMSHHEPPAERASTRDISAGEEEIALRPNRMRFRTDT